MQPGVGPALAGWGRRERTPIPSLAGSTAFARPAPGYSRTSSVGRDTVGPARARIEREIAAARGEARIRLPSPPVTRESILERYGKPEAAMSRPAPGATRSEMPGPSRLRGAIARNAPVQRTAPAAPLRATRPGPSGMQRLARLQDENPEKARDLMRAGRAVTTATSAGVRTAVGVAGSVACGWSGGWFWDPWGHPWWSGQGCPPSWAWWYSPSWYYGWTSACWPWWGGGWGFGFHSKHFSWWWSDGGWPYYAYSCPSPAYYSTVLYDTYDPPPVVHQTVIYQQAAEEPVYADPVALGEGSIAVGEKGAANAAQGAGSTAESGADRSLAEQCLALGDQAFREGRFSDAVHHYAKAIEFAPERGVLHLILSDALFATGDYHYAAYALRRALELDPTLVDSGLDKHAFYGDPTEFDRQLELLERYLADHFLDDDARLLLATNYLFAKRPSQALELLESPFSVDVRGSTAGRIVVERARKSKDETAPK